MQYVVWVETIIAGQSVAVQRAAVLETHAEAVEALHLASPLELHAARVLGWAEQLEIIQERHERRQGNTEVIGSYLEVELHRVVQAQHPRDVQRLGLAGLIDTLLEEHLGERETPHDRRGQRSPRGSGCG